MIEPACSIFEVSSSVVHNSDLVGSGISNDSTILLGSFLTGRLPFSSGLLSAEVSLENKSKNLITSIVLTKCPQFQSAYTKGQNRFK